MRARIAELASPRRLVATECCVAGFLAAAAVVASGAGFLGFMLVAACALAMAPALVVVGRLERTKMAVNEHGGVVRAVAEGAVIEVAEEGLAGGEPWLELRERSGGRIDEIGT